MRCIYTLPLFVFPLLLFGQPLLFENYTSKQGLSQNNCTSISQDADGFMWFGTWDGLNRYDGRQFKIFSQQTEAGKNLPGNRISSLYFDKANNLLWIAAGGGTCFYVPSGDSIAKVSAFFPFAHLLDKISVKKIISVRENEYWFLTYNYGLIFLNTKSATLQSFFTGDAEKSKLTAITHHDGKITVANLFNLYVMQSAGSSYKPVRLHEGYRFPQINALASCGGRLWVGTIAAGCYMVKSPIEKKENIVVTDLVFGGIQAFGLSDNELWIGTRGSGIHKYDVKTRMITRALHNQFDPATPVTNIGISFFKDRQGNMWCGLLGGIAKHDPYRYQFNNINGATSLNASLTDKAILKMYTAGDGSRFVGTQNKGILEWNKTTNEFIQYPATAIVEKANNIIYDITEDEAGNLWSATCGGLLQLDRRTKKVTYYPEKGNTHQRNSMYALTKMKNADSLLIASDDGLLIFSIREKKWVTDRESPGKSTLEETLRKTSWVSSFYEDANSTIWICSKASGLAKYHYLKNELVVADPKQKLLYRINHLLPDGPHFILSSDNGVVIYDHQKNKIVKQVETLANGISNVCYAAQKDDNGFFWVSTISGLCKLDRQYNLLQKFNTGSGLAFREYYTACTMKDTDGTLAFGGEGGITSFNPSLLKLNSFSPTPVITAIGVNDKAWPLRKNPELIKELSFEHKQNFITFGFAANNFSNETNSVFSYRLKGLNDNWSEPATGNTAGFTSLPPGNYIFELRSANSDGVWSDGIKTLAITIHPAWWQSWWFRISAFLLLAALVTFFIRRRIKTIRREAELKQQMAELEIKGLHAQMNPHFIFNSLNSIKEMILEQENQNASRYLSKFAQLIRTNLEHSRQTFITVRQSVDHLNQYLEMEKLRFEDFSYVIEVDENLLTEDTRIAPMLVQPLVENAIWHGLRSKDQDRMLVIRFLKKGHQVICEIEDNGVGILHTKNNNNGRSPVHRSLGITNVRERLAVLNEKYNMNCSLQIADKSEFPSKKESGTLAVLELSE